MEHARKLVLVPSENIQQINNINNNPGNNNNNNNNDQMAAEVSSVQTKGTPLTRLDEQMAEILKSNAYDSDRDKWSAYLQVLQRYLSLTMEANQQQLVSGDKATKKESPENAAETATLIAELKSHLNDTVIVDSVPKKYRRKAKMLLNSLHRNASSNKKIQWDNDGVVTIAGTRIPNSNIIDLVNDAMRARKRPHPVGRIHFARFLKRIQMPREFIGNNELLRETTAAASTPRRHLVLPDDRDERSDEASSSDEVHTSGFLTVNDDEEKAVEDGADEQKADTNTPKRKRRNKQEGRGRGEEPNKKKIKTKITWATLKL